MVAVGVASVGTAVGVDVSVAGVRVVPVAVGVAVAADCHVNS